MFGLCRSPLIRSATTADISDSIAPSIATVSAGRMRTGISAALNGGIEASRQARRDPAEARADRLDVETEERAAATVPPTSAMTVPGMRGYRRRSTIIPASAQPARIVAVGEIVDALRARPTMRAANSDGTTAISQPEEILDLRARNEHGDAVREPDHDRPRKVLDGIAHPGHAEDHEHDARHHRAPCRGR